MNFRERNLSSDKVFIQSGPEGMLGKNPLKYASAKIGKKIIEGMGELIDRKAMSH